MTYLPAPLRLALCCLLLAGAGGAADDPVADFIAGSPRDRAVERGLAFLRAQAGPDGALGAQHRTALTGLALLAHVANGVMPGDPEVGGWMGAAIDAVLAGQDGDGYFGRQDGSRMYGHGIATLLLAQLSGECGDEARELRVRSALLQAVEVILRAQKVAKPAGLRGGWRYGPNDNGSDLSLSGWQLLALHACRQIGVPVPPEAIADASAYARGLISEHGEVGYEARGQDRPALRGLALLVLALGQGPVGTPPAEIATITGRITDEPIAWQGSFFFYRAYYDAVGMSRAAPVAWAAYGPRLERLLLEHQAADGSWPAPPGNDEAGNGPVYATSMALLALSVQRHLLPAHHF